MNSLLDDVNALLKLKPGDLGRLEHIKKTLEAGHMLYISDSKYLQELTKQYLEYEAEKRFTKYNSFDYPEYAHRIKDTESSEDGNSSSNVDESKLHESKLHESKVEKLDSLGNVFCWKCGTKNPEL